MAVIPSFAIANLVSSSYSTFGSNLNEDVVAMKVLTSLVDAYGLLLTTSTLTSTILAVDKAFEI